MLMRLLNGRLRDLLNSVGLVCDDGLRNRRWSDGLISMRENVLYSRHRSLSTADARIMLLLVKIRAQVERSVVDVCFQYTSIFHHLPVVISPREEGNRARVGSVRT